MISLIIPTHNDEARLVEVLDPLVPASMEALIRELIIVDAGSTDATGSAARFYSPCAVAVDSAGNVFVADYNNHTIRKVTSAGVVTT